MMKATCAQVDFERLLAGITATEKRIVEIMAEIEQALAGGQSS